MSDHSWVHVQVVLNIALRLLRLLVKAGIEPAMVTDHGMKRARRRGRRGGRGASPRRRHVDPPRRPRGLQPVHGRRAASSAARRASTSEPERTVVISEILHAIIGHRRRGEPYTLEAGVVRVADALDMAEGRSRLPIEGGQYGIHALSAAAIDEVRIEAGEERAGQDRDRDEQLRRHLPGRRPARHQAPRHPAGGPRRGDRPGPAARPRSACCPASACSERGPAFNSQWPRTRRNPGMGGEIRIVSLFRLWAGKVARNPCGSGQLAARQHGVISRRQLLDSWSELGPNRSAGLRVGRLHRTWRGVYAVGTPSAHSRGLVDGRGPRLWSRRRSQP